MNAHFDMYIFVLLATANPLYSLLYFSIESEENPYIIELV